MHLQKIHYLTFDHILWSILKFMVQNRGISLVARISNIFLGVLEIPDILWGVKGRC